MSSVKKLSLSGFKSTFRRKTNRGTSEGDRSNGANEPRESHSQSENESATRNVEYQNVDVKPGLLSSQSKRVIHQNGNEIDMGSLENKVSRWRFLHKSSDKSKCSINHVNANEYDVDTTVILPGSGSSSAKIEEQQAISGPSANGHIVVCSSRNDNERGYISGRKHKLPHMTANTHTFRPVESASHCYINDNVKRMENKDSLERNVNELDCVKQSPAESEGDDCLTNHCSISGSLTAANMKCDVNDNAEVHKEYDTDSEQTCPCDNSNGDSSDAMTAENSAPEDVPPAIPPKPATLFSNGQWTIDRDRRSSPTECLESSPAVEGPPPRPPARSKTRYGVDVSLPFYRQYLEREKACPRPTIYEDVHLDYNHPNRGLAGELSKLPRQPWYWGPMSQEAAEEKLADRANGSFLVRDSSDERYLLTLSFKSGGRTLHTRIEHRNGLFSLNDSEGHSSVIELIHSVVAESQKGVYGYMNDSTGIQNFPARLTQWVSRYSEVKSLQHLCRFVIRETYPRHHIRRLPLPKKINEYLLENQY
ncbi:uncharacterized protein [Diadema setosum]|uniref:uncharacterized protein n=1 Tax=Diadema setosum TaxID=31175 RepID=UPI003B3A7500